MTDILPPAGWPNVRQLETNEFATGGANGNMNEQAKSLAARSELLKQYAALPYESKTGGYALNERVQIATGDIVRSTIASNVNNPNVDMTGWKFNDNTVESIADLLAIQNPKDGQVTYAKSYLAGLNKGGDFFEYKSSRQLENDGGNIINGWERKVSQTYLNLENYGATGVGSDDYNDQTAMERITAVVKNSTEKGFTIHIPYGTYVWGRQTWEPGTGFTNKNGIDISFNNMTDKYVYLQSDNATIKARSGMHYGVFDKNTKAPFTTIMPFYPGTASWNADKDKVAVVETGYIVNFNNIKGLVTSGILNIYGSRETVNLGGQYGDSGWQLIEYCFRVARVEKIDISNIHARNSCLDGVYVAGVNSPTNPDIFNAEYSGTVRNVTSIGNGRQACSFAGGQNISWYDCNFDKTAMPDFNIKSMPMSCFDIEAEVYPIRNARFYNCYFGTAPTTSLVADSANSKGVSFFNCKFINAIGVTAWVRKPQYKFNNCYFNGYMEGQYGTNIESDRTVYNNCEFTDDPIVNPNMSRLDTYLMNITGSNPIFNNCTLNVYRTGLIASLSTPVAKPVEYNNLIINMYGYNGNCAMNGLNSIRIRDFRENKTGIAPTIYGGGVISTELAENGVFKITPFGFSGRLYRFLEIQPSSVVYNPSGATVTKATGTDNTATVLNALIDSLRSSGKIV